MLFFVQRDMKVIQLIRDLEFESVPRVAQFMEIKEVLIEFLVILKLLPEVRAEKEILIKGFADGDLGGRCKELQSDGWCRELLEPYNTYDFRRINIRQPALEGDPNPIIYKRKTDEVIIPLYYQNTQLPDLRARFTQYAFVNKMLSVCAFDESEGRLPAQSHILKGFEFSHKDPGERKAQVFLHVH